MPVRSSSAEWQGSLKDGKGVVSFGSGAFKGNYSFPSRFEDGSGTNPEELIAAGHAACYAMALSAGLGKNGFNPICVRAEAKVHLEKVADGFAITTIELSAEAEVPDIDEVEFHKQAESAKVGCPISKALAGAEIKLNAKLLQPAR